MKLVQQIGCMALIWLVAILGVEKDHGMWLDFNECFYHTHDVAVVISIQGINPITGQKMVAEKALRLEQYHKKCPIHNVAYQQDRYCEKCGFKWPGQNYLATTGTPEMRLWLDGFRTPEGTVRQYIFTEDEMRGVASQLIGKERVFAIGIAYYLSKNKKPYTLKRPEKRELSVDHTGDSFTPPIFFSPWHTSQSLNKKSNAGSPPSYMGLGHDSNTNIDSLESMNISSSGGSAGDAPIGSNMTNSSKKSSMRGVITPDSAPVEAQAVQPITPVKQLEIGAGALIQQQVYDDPKILNYWEEKPAGMIYINYCDEGTKKKILDAGRRADKKDGFMKDLKVGG